MIVPETKPLMQMLEEFRQRHLHMALVVDEFGTVTGLLTVEDVLEQIVGEIEDEFDERLAKPPAEATAWNWTAPPAFSTSLRFTASSCLRTGDSRRSPDTFSSSLDTFPGWGIGGIRRTQVYSRGNGAEPDCAGSYREDRAAKRWKPKKRRTAR